MRALFRATIWHPDAISLVEGSASLELKRYVLPAFDFLVIIMGVNAILTGMPSFNVLYDDEVSLVSSWALLVSGVLALAGISFPRLWVAEAAGKLLMLLVLGGYAAALWVLYFRGEGNRGFVAGAVTALILLPLWNLYRLGRERRVRNALRHAGEVK